MKILITAGKTATALKVTKAFTNSDIVLGDYGDMPSINTATYSLKALGNWNADVIAHNLLTKALDFGVDYILPLYIEEIEAVNKSIILFEEFGIEILTPNYLDKPIKKTNSAAWAVFKKGELIFSSIANDLLAEKGIVLNLNGVYSFREQADNFDLVCLNFGN